MTTSANRERSEKWRGRRYIVLARQSDDGEGTDSTRAQVDLIVERCEALGMVYVDQVVLEGVSGSVPGKRTDFEALIKRKQQFDDFDVVAVQRRDRLTRGGSGHGNWVEFEFARVGVELFFAGEQEVEGPYAAVIQTFKYESARDFARSLSQRSAQGRGLALLEGRDAPFTHTPFGCHRLYCSSGSEPQFIIRNLKDGRQEKLHPETLQIIDVLGTAGTTYGHYRKQANEQVTLVPGDPVEAEVVRQIMIDHWRNRLGGGAIADGLNRSGIRTPTGKTWSKRSVESIWENTVYAGVSMCNIASTAIYHERGTGVAPKEVNLSDSVLAQGQPPKRLRPPEEWVEVELPYMKDFLPADVRDKLLSEMRQLRKLRYERKLKRTTQKKSNSRHLNSPYLLTGLLQDALGEKLVGVTIGKVGYKQRRYRHKQGRREYLKGSPFTRTLHAEIIEQAVVQTMIDTLSDEALFRGLIVEVVDQTPATGPSGAVIESLINRKAELQKKIQHIVLSFDAAALAAVKEQVDAMSREIAAIDQQIVKARPRVKQQPLDAQALVEQTLARYQALASNLADAPVAQLREAINTYVEKVVVDMQTQQFEVFLRIPEPQAVCLVDNSPSSSGHQTPPLPEGFIRLAEVDCRYVKMNKQSPTCDCRRRRAA